MSDNDKTGFNKLIRSRLGDDRPGENNWNIPPTIIFENAMASLEEGKERKRIYWLPIFIAFLVFLGVALILVVNQKRFEEIDAKIESLHAAQLHITQSKNTDAKINKNNSALSTTLTNTDGVEAEEESGIENNASAKLPQLSASSESKTTNNFALESTVLKNKFTPSPSSDSVVPNRQKSMLSLKAVAELPTKNNEEAVEAEKQISGDNKASTKQIEHASSILLNTIKMRVQDESHFDLPGSSLPHSTASENKHKSGRFTPHLLVGYNLSSFDMYNTHLNNASLTKYDKIYLGYQLGAGVDHRLSSTLFLNYSLSFKSIINKSLYQGQMAYNKSSEDYTTNGDLVYSSSMNIPTPTGIQVRSIQMSVEKDEMNDGDILENQANIRQQFWVTSLATSVNYISWKSGRFDFIINGGLSANVIFNIKQSMDMEIHHHNKLMMKKSTSARSKFEGNKFYYTGFVGIGVKYKITRHLSILFDTNMERSFNSILANPQGDGPFTKLNSINTSLRVGYRF